MRAHRRLQARESFVPQELEVDVHGYLIASPLSASNRCTPAGSTARCTLEPGVGPNVGRKPHGHGCPIFLDGVGEQGRLLGLDPHAGIVRGHGPVHHHLVAERLDDVDVQLEAGPWVVRPDRAQALGTDPDDDVAVGHARPLELEVAGTTPPAAHRARAAGSSAASR